eukprot:scaffold7182_cov258-Pinguiococcus_pyrenoidosus.AAC.4
MDARPDIFNQPVRAVKLAIALVQADFLLAQQLLDASRFLYGMQLLPVNVASQLELFELRLSRLQVGPELYQVVLELALLLMQIGDELRVRSVLVDDLLHVVRPDDFLQSQHCFAGLSGRIQLGLILELEHRPRLNARPSALPTLRLPVIVLAAAVEGLGKAHHQATRMAARRPVRGWEGRTRRGRPVAKRREQWERSWLDGPGGSAAPLCASPPAASAAESRHRGDAPGLPRPCEWSHNRCRSPGGAGAGPRPAAEPTPPGAPASAGARRPWPGTCLPRGESRREHRRALPTSWWPPEAETRALARMPRHRQPPAAARCGSHPGKRERPRCGTGAATSPGVPSAEDGACRRRLEGVEA